jgi:NAD(P)-dependent dehydrogenase (short-subunit alcohol dehydrogenase family)
MNISGQTAIVTGGASGLGEATARALAAAGAKVGILDMNEDLAQKVAAEIGGAAAVCDVVDPASHEAAVASVREASRPAPSWWAATATQARSKNSPVRSTST